MPTIDFQPASRNPIDFKYPLQSKARRALDAIANLLSLPTDPKILLVDLSHHNGVVDFEKVAQSNVQGVILKVSESNYFKDSRFEENWRAAHAADLPVMTYHFFRDRTDEADWYLQCADSFLNAVDGHTACWLDVETNNGVSKETRANRAFAFCNSIQAEGINAGMYSSPYFVSLLFPPNDPRWDNVFQWVAHWISANQPTLPSGWSWEKLVLWQFGISPTHSWTPAIAGVPGAVDVNWAYFSDKQKLREWLGFTLPPPSPPPPPPPPEEIMTTITRMIEKTTSGSTGFRSISVPIPDGELWMVESMHVLVNKPVDNIRIGVRDISSGSPPYPQSFVASTNLNSPTNWLEAWSGMLTVNPGEELFAAVLGASPNTVLQFGYHAEVLK